ncbi:hypothetical protein Misp01_47210 [Microtetraspora sp. NBRC 13810]|nr:hypothetical protein Misp01_47210 [Microtetraspora sp. NBRC 13810]
MPRLTRVGDVPVILVLAWSGWLAVPWSLGGPAQVRPPAAEPAHRDTPSAAAGLTPPRAPSPLTPVRTRQAEATPRTQTPAGVANVPQSATEVASLAGVSAAATQADKEARADEATAGTGVSVVAARAGEVVVRGDEEAVRAGEVAVRAVLEERRRIAGEVHDVAGHGLAAIAMQAGIALMMLDEQPEQARESLEAIRATSTRALAELRAALDTMHPLPARTTNTTLPSPSPFPSPSPSPATATATATAGAGAAVPATAAADAVRGEPGLRHLRQVVDAVRAGGLPVELEVGELGGVPHAHVDAAVYRVVRESLTNVLRHAGPTRAVVRVAHEPRAAGSGDLVVEIADRGRGVPGGTLAEGRGLTGMRARVEAAGGGFTAGPREDGGFRVVARFPKATA